MDGQTTIENYFKKKNKAQHNIHKDHKRKATEIDNSTFCVSTFTYGNNHDCSKTPNSNLIPLEEIFDDIDASEEKEKLQKQKYVEKYSQKTYTNTKSIQESQFKRSKCTFSTPTKSKKRSLSNLLWAPKKLKTLSKINTVSFLMNEANIQQAKVFQTQPKVSAVECRTFKSQQLCSETSCYNDEEFNESTNLKLPLKFKRLHEIFVFLDAIIGLNFNNKHNDYYLRWSDITKLMLKHKECVFTYKMFGQIRSLLPDVIDIKVQRQRAPLSTVEMEYALKPVYSYLDECNQLIFTSQQASHRSTLFKQKLLKIVYNCHLEYLKKVGLHDMIHGKKLTNWHPDFKLQEVDEVQPCELPSLNMKNKVLSSARNKFLKKSTSLKVSKVQLIRKQYDDLPIVQCEKLSNEHKAKVMLKMTRTSEDHNKLEKLKILPNFAIFLKNVFRQEKKTTLKLKVVISRLMSYVSLKMNAMFIQELVELLEQDSNNWLKLLRLNQETFVKIDESVDFVGHLKKNIQEFELKR